MKRLIIQTAVLGMAVIWLAGCGGRPLVQKPVLTPKPTPELIGEVLSRDFLPDGYDEDTAARIYAYFVMRPEHIQSIQTRRLVGKIARAFWLGLVAVQSPAESNQASIAYWVVQDADRDAMNAASLSENWEEWIDQYHFERADLIAQRVTCPGNGPFLIAAFQPLAAMAGPFQRGTKGVLVIDLGLANPDDYLGCLQAVQQNVFSLGKKTVSQWPLEKIRRVLGPWFEERINDAVFILTRSK